MTSIKVYNTTTYNAAFSDKNLNSKPYNTRIFDANVKKSLDYLKV